MFDFGIAGYQPAWLDSRGGVVREHGHRLRGLAGRTLTRVWMVWDLRDDEWFCDCPVLFDFDGQQVEINHHKLGDLSLTWNTIDPTRPVRWPGFDLEWRPEPIPGLQALRGLPLMGAELLEWTGRDVAQGNVDISFAFETGRVTVFNALDENGVSFALPVRTSASTRSIDALRVQVQRQFEVDSLVSRRLFRSTTASLITASERCGRISSSRARRR